MIDRDLLAKWERFYTAQGYTEEQSRILASQICCRQVRGHRVTVDNLYVFRPRSAHARTAERLSLHVISYAISNSV